MILNYKVVTRFGAPLSLLLGGVPFAKVLCAWNVFISIRGGLAASAFGSWRSDIVSLELTGVAFLTSPYGSVNSGSLERVRIYKVNFGVGKVSTGFLVSVHGLLTTAG